MAGYVDPEYVIGSATLSVASSASVSVTGTNLSAQIGATTQTANADIAITGNAANSALNGVVVDILTAGEVAVHVSGVQAIASVNSPVFEPDVVIIPLDAASTAKAPIVPPRSSVDAIVSAQGFRIDTAMGNVGAIGETAKPPAPVVIDAVVNISTVAGRVRSIPHFGESKVLHFSRSEIAQVRGSAVQAASVPVNLSTARPITTDYELEEFILMVANL